MLKIISGKYKNKTLLPFKNKIVKPTKNIVRKAIFDIIKNNIENANVLDLFSGSGALGIEALSRNANFVYFVDKNLKTINYIKKNLFFLNIKNAKTLNIDYIAAIKKFAKNKVKFDIILVDPPYCFNNKQYQTIINLFKKNNILNKKTIIILESSFIILNLNFKYKKIKYYKYGKTFLTVIWQ